MGIRRANRPVSDKNGLVTGTITEMGERTFERMVKGKGPLANKGRDSSIETITSYGMTTKVAGITDEEIQITTLVGRVLNDQPVASTGRNKASLKTYYNRFTTLCLQLGLIEEKELATANEARLKKLEKALDGMVGKKITFETAIGKNGFTAIDLESVEVVG